MQHVTRDRMWVEREYGREKWPAVEQQIRATQGPLHAVLPRLIRNRSSHGIHHDREITVRGVRTTTPTALAFSAYLGWIAHTLATYAADVDVVIELGSGWGLQLFNLYLTGGPPDAHYIGGEFTAAGRRASEALAAREPALQFDAVPFDYHAPSLEVRRYSSAVIFTAHSVEQIPTLPDNFLSFVKELAENVTVIHFEPIGWQFSDGESAYATEHDYNKNLVRLLQRAQTMGSIRIRHTAIDVIGLNPDNPTTLLIWEPSR